MFQIIKKNGFILPASIFLMVGVFSLLIAIFAIIKTNNINIKYTNLETKAFLVAKTGIEYGFYQVKKNSTCTSTPTTITLTGDLNTFKFTYTCTQHTSNEAGNILNFYKITSIGCNTSLTDCPASTIPDIENYVEKSLTSMIY